MKRIVLILLAGVITSAALFLVIASVPSHPDASSIAVKTGTVSRIDFNDRTKDINVFLDDGVIYYINRGLQNVTDCDSLHQALTRKAVRITFYEPGVDLIGKMTRRKGRHVYKIESVALQGNARDL